jgi:general stress protein 26
LNPKKNLNINQELELMKINNQQSKNKNYFQNSIHKRKSKILKKLKKISLLFVQLKDAPKSTNTKDH